MKPFLNHLFACAALLMLLAGVGHAAEAPYSKAQFDQAVAQHKPVILHFAADWCPTCKAQKPIVEQLIKGDKLKSVTLLVANYDTETALKKQLRITQQSTFVVFKDGKEVGRSTGDTSKAGIEALFDKAI
ncbi:MAG TPA: thioredoxin family protein [Burkholderiales bacterium]|jgi:thioredoxin-like negative regulator of GroEL|nr:thioredoxin family protein [Burkholderiales bacterium]